MYALGSNTTQTLAQHGGTLTTDVELGAAALLAQARALRSQARRANPVLADAYLRRAAELSLEAWSRAVRTGPVAVEDVQAAVAAA